MADEVWKVLRTTRLKLERIYEEFATRDETSGSPIRASDFTEAAVLGAIAFPVTIGYMQNAVFRPLRITSNKRVVGALFGGISVAFSGGVASVLFISYVNFSRYRTARALEFYKEKLDTCFPLVEFDFQMSDILFYGAGSMIVFKLFGGRFRSVLPSSLIHPGSFARSSLPANSKAYASSTAKRQLAKIGRQFGCHTCGRKRGRLFVGDHIPPNKLVKPGQSQRFFPQCDKCSRVQGAALSSTKTNSLVKTHGTTLRPYHLWLPVPMAIMWLKS